MLFCILFFLGFVLYKLGKISDEKWPKALAFANICIKISPNWHKAYSTRAALNVYLENTDAAIADFESAIACCKDQNQCTKLKQRLKSLQRRKGQAKV